MTKCQRCGIKFPDELIHPLLSRLGHRMCCPICALEITNTIHGISRKKFDGENANILLKKALKFKEKSCQK